MDDHRFFKFVWRFNGLVLMLTLLGVIVVALYSVIRELVHTRPPQVIRNVADDPSGEEKWRLGYPQQIDGTVYVYIPLISEKEEIEVRERKRKAFSSYSDEGYSDPTKNILFVNTETSEMRWLFPTNNQLVTQVQMLSATAQEEARKRSIRAILYQVVQADSDGNKRLTVDDDTVVALSQPDGSRYKEVLASTDRMIDVMLLENKTIFLMYQTKGAGYSSTLRLGDFSTIRKVELPKVPN